MGVQTFVSMKGKVYIYFEGKKLISTKLPKSWNDAECIKVTEMFAEYYNKKHPGGELDMAKLQLTELKSGTVIPSNGIISALIQPYADLQVVEMSDDVEAPAQNPWTSGGHVPAAARAEDATTGNQKGFGDTYSKWDTMEFSDDEKDFHPNIDNNLMIRLKREKRAERKKEEAQLVKQLEKEIEAGNEEAKEKLEEFYKNRKLCAEDVCTEGVSHSMINSGMSEFEKAHAESKAKEKKGAPRSEAEEEEEYAKFQREHQHLILGYAEMRVEDSEEFILENPFILQQEATGHLLIHMLELEMSGQRFEMTTAARQYLMLQNIIDLSKQIDRDPRSSVRPFFREIQQEEKLAELVKETEAFAEKIIARAIVKQEERAERELQQEDEYEEVEVPYEERLGPGGLDPVEVFPTLPEDLQEAFNSKDIGALQAAIEKMPMDQAQHHLKRMTDSGLWVPQGGDGDDNEEE